MVAEAVGMSDRGLGAACPLLAATRQEVAVATVVAPMAHLGAETGSSCNRCLITDFEIQPSSSGRSRSLPVVAPAGTLVQFGAP